MEAELERKVSRREFLKKAALGIVGVGVGAYALDRVFFSGSEVSSDTFKGSGPKELWKWSKEAFDYIKLGEDRVKCGLCPHGCLLDVGDRGVCRVRVNFNGRLYSLVYGNPCSVHVDPIEKKPLFHFLPGTTSFSIGTAGCNLRCLNCQNWEISQFQPEQTQNLDLMPEKAVEAARNNGCASISYTYNDPVVFYEYVHDTAGLARKNGLRSVVVTAGYVNEEPLRRLCKVVDAIKVDLKGFREDTYNKLNSATLQPVLNTMKTVKDEGVWMEIVNLVVPSWTDSLDVIKEMSQWLYKSLGPDYPLHFSRFNPEYKLASLPQTPVETLEAARRIAMDEGLKFVYIGNVPGHKAESTYCPKDGGVAIERRGYSIAHKNVDESGYCKKCGEKIPGVWK